MTESKTWEILRRTYERQLPPADTSLYLTEGQVRTLRRAATGETKEWLETMLANPSVVILHRPEFELTIGGTNYYAYPKTSGSGYILGRY